MNLLQFINEFSYGIYAGLYHNFWNFRKSFGKARNMFTKKAEENDSIIPQEIMPLEVLAVGYGRTGTVCNCFFFEITSAIILPQKLILRQSVFSSCSFRRVGIPYTPHTTYV